MEDNKKTYRLKVDKEDRYGHINRIRTSCGRRLGPQQEIEIETVENPKMNGEIRLLVTEIHYNDHLGDDHEDAWKFKGFVLFIAKNQARTERKVAMEGRMSKEGGEITF